MKNIVHYIELDCSKSNVSFILNNLINSNLQKYFNFKDIDCDKILKTIPKSIRVDACKLHMNHDYGLTRKDCADILKISEESYNRYLREGCRIFDWFILDENKYKLKINDGHSIEIYDNEKVLYEFKSLNDVSKNSFDIFGAIYRDWETDRKSVV